MSSDTLGSGSVCNSLSDGVLASCIPEVLLYPKEESHLEAVGLKAACVSEPRPWEVPLGSGCQCGRSNCRETDREQRASPRRRRVWLLNTS